MRVHIAIAFDQNYISPFYALLESILVNAGNVQLHLIATGLDAEQLTAIRSHAASKGIDAKFYDIQDERLESIVMSTSWTKAVYYRLYFPFLIDTSIERLLYIDTDTIVLKDLGALFRLELNGFPVAAVYDNYVMVQPLIGLDTPGQYFNSGVLLIDVEKWRLQQVSERTLDYLLRYPERIRYVDQCALNAVLKGNWLQIDNSYNFLYSYLPEGISAGDLSKVVANLSIIHYNLDRPWLMLCKNRLRKYFHTYHKASPNKKRENVIKDFSVSKIPAWLRIRIIEYYQDQQWLKTIWRKVKK